MTALVLASVILGVGGVGVWMWSRRRRENAAPPADEASQPATRGGRRRYD